MAGRMVWEGLLRDAALIANWILRPTNVRMTRIQETVDLREITDDPIEANYRAAGRFHIVNVPLHHCRILHSTGLSCDRQAYNPLIMTLDEYGRRKCLSYRGSHLERFFIRWQPSNAAEALSLEPKDCASAISESPALAYVLPWTDGRPADELANRKATIEQDNRRHHRWVPAANGWKCWGPVSEEVGELEFKRLISIYDAIKKDGFIERLDDRGIGGLVLRHVNETRILISPGHHRLAALVAAGYDHAPIRLAPCIIDRRDIDRWPNVRSELFTRNQAIQVFDRLFEGHGPDGMKPQL